MYIVVAVSEGAFDQIFLNKKIIFVCNPIWKENIDLTPRWPRHQHLTMTLSFLT